MKPLFQPHPRNLVLLHGDLENAAAATRSVFVGTPGSVVSRSNGGGFAYYAHQYYDAAGRRHERYLGGPVGDPDAEAAAEEMREGIAEATAQSSSCRQLIREGYSALDNAAFAVIAALANHGLFDAGAVLVGSHACGALLNTLGARASSWPTEDIDVARFRALSFADAAERDMAVVLKASHLEFVEVPPLERSAPSTSFKAEGRSQLQVDMLAPGVGAQISVVSVPELRTHATALPYLGWLIEHTQPAIVISRHGPCRVRVPLAERFALHKLIVAQLRTGRNVKTVRDIEQAAALAAVVAQTFPGVLAETRALLPSPAQALLKRSLPLAKNLLAAHPQAWEELGLD